MTLRITRQLNMAQIILLLDVIRNENPFEMRTH